MNNDEGERPAEPASAPQQQPAPLPADPAAGQNVVPAQPAAPNDAADSGYASEPIDDGEEAAEDEWLARSFTTVTWSGQEFIQHTKPRLWYVRMAAAFLAAAALAYLLTRDLFSTGTIIIVGGMLMYLGARKPRMQTYVIDGKGLQTGDKRYQFEQFRSFAVLQEAGQSTVALYPMQRFMPLITLYFPVEEKERITDALAEHLPLEERDHDVLDRLLHRIKL